MLPFRSVKIVEPAAGGVKAVYQKVDIVKPHADTLDEARIRGAMPMPETTCPNGPQ